MRLAYLIIGIGILAIAALVAQPGTKQIAGVAIGICVLAVALGMYWAERRSRRRRRRRRLRT
jgi:multisubunit Na+/H+ antiporter MnhB subunit